MAAKLVPRKGVVFLEYIIFLIIVLVLLDRLLNTTNKK